MNLFWEDIENNKYLLGKLYKSDEYYYFEINESGLFDSIRHGCFGIGSINIAQKINKSTTLFDFFKRRIPSEDSQNIESFLSSIGLKFYDDFEILQRTHGRLLTDRYYLE